MNSESVLLRANNLQLTYNSRQVLDGIDIEIRRGEIITLIGPNGAGKTTLVKVLLGLVSPDSGDVTRASNLTIGYMPQRLHLSENLPLTVERFLRLTIACDDVRYKAVLDEVGIAHLLGSPMQSLSGGEHQRVLLARAMLRVPDLLVLDEPAQGIDVTGQEELYRLISQIRDSHGCSVLLISHDLHLVMATTDRVLCINHHICCAGRPESVSQHPAYLELFGSPIRDGLALYRHHHDHAHDIHGNVVESDSKDHQGCDHG